MIVSRLQAHQIAAGRKTQARIPVGIERAVARRNGTSYTSQPYTPTIGSSFRVQLTDSDLYVKILDVDHELLGAITFADVRAEGHRTTDEFKAWWVQLHDRAWVAKHDDPPGPDGLTVRFDQRHAHKPVWVIAVAVDTEARPRFLAQTGRSDSAGEGYTANPESAMPAEPEAVDEVTQRRISDHGRQADALVKAGAAEQLLQELRDIPVRRARLKQLAMSQGIDVRDQLRMIDRAQAGIERKIREQAQNRQAAA